MTHLLPIIGWRNQLGLLITSIAPARNLPMITINNSLTIPHDEVELTFSRSQGPGGQNVNKVNSKVTLHWDVENSRSISVRLKQRIYSKHSGKINNDGKLVVSSQKSREQHQNRTDWTIKNAVVRSKLEDRGVTNINSNALRLFCVSVVHKIHQIVDNVLSHTTAEFRTS